jgi:DNA-binding HxlR family transcriptional regulator
MARRQAHQHARPEHEHDTTAGPLSGAPTAGARPAGSEAASAASAATATTATAQTAGSAALDAARAPLAPPEATSPAGRGRPRGFSSRALRALPGGRQDESPLALDRLIHERLRLGIVSALAVNEALTFVELKGLLETTDGNLSVHARKLEEAGYVSCTKAFEGRTPRTEYRLTRAGKHALERYLDHMEALIKATRATSEE